MIPTLSPGFGVDNFTASLRLARGGGGVHNRRENAIIMDHRGFNVLPMRNMPAWMSSPALMFTKSRHHHRPMDACICASRLGGTGLQHPLPRRKTTTVEGVRNGGLSVRGGAGGVSPAGPLGAVLFATAFLSAILERQTKIGSVVGAPLVSFGTFCILRCHSNIGKFLIAGAESVRFS